MLILVNFLFCNFICGILFYIFHIAAHLTLLLLVSVRHTVHFWWRRKQLLSLYGLLLVYVVHYDLRM